MWGDPLRLLVHIVNATPTLALPNITPFEAWHGRKPDLSMLCTFSYKAYIHRQRDQRSGLQLQTGECIYLGFESDYKGWRCYDPETKKITISRDIIFDKNDFPGLSSATSIDHLEW